MNNQDRNYVIMFGCGFLIDKINLFPFLLGFLFALFITTNPTTQHLCNYTKKTFGYSQHIFNNILSNNKYDIFTKIPKYDDMIYENDKINNENKTDNNQIDNENDNENDNEPNTKKSDVEIHSNNHSISEKKSIL